MSEEVGGRRRIAKRQLIARISACVVAIILLCVCVAGWLAYLGNQIQNDLTSSAKLAQNVRADLLAGDVASASATFQSMQSHIDNAHRASNDPLWKGAGSLPVVGANFSAVSELAVSANDVADRAIAPLLSDTAMISWNSLAPIEGAVDLQPIERAAPLLRSASNTVRLSHDRLSAIDRSSLLDPIARPLLEATNVLGEMGLALQAASTTATLLPEMLGAGEERNYLLLVQNSAEVRATGGIPGALAVMTVREGALELTAQGSATELGAFNPAVIVDPAQETIYSARMGRFMQSTNLTPHFPTAAQTAATMWETRKPGSNLDGVIAIDPVTLSYVLRSTGPIELPVEDLVANEQIAASGLPRTLSADNVVRTLLSDVYSEIEDPREQDEYFAAVASELFKLLSSGEGDSRGLIEALVRSANEGRIFVWSSHSDEQDTIASTKVAGSVTGAGTGGAAFGAYFNDGTGAKMDYYIRRKVQLQEGCSVDGYLQYTLTATLTNTAPVNAAETLPAYVLGGVASRVKPGSVRTNFIGYGPDRAQLQTARIDGMPVPLGSYRHGDRPVGVLTTTVAPGDTATVELDFTNIVQQSEPALDVTPTLQPTSEVVLPLKNAGKCS